MYAYITCIIANKKCSRHVHLSDIWKIIKLYKTDALRHYKYVISILENSLSRNGILKNSKKYYSLIQHWSFNIDTSRFNFLISQNINLEPKKGKHDWYVR